MKARAAKRKRDNADSSVVAKGRALRGTLHGRNICYGIALLISACATSGPLRATRTFASPADEVFDAAWLAIEARGFSIDTAQPDSGELHAVPDTTGWALEVSALGNEQQLRIAPDSAASRAALDAVLEPFEADLRRMLAAWRELPEVTFDGRRNVLRVPGFSLGLPEAWALLDFDVTHRNVTAQPRRTRTAVQPTLRIELDRRRPRPQLLATAKRAMGIALTARNRLTFPDELQQGVLGVLDGSSPHTITWYGEVITLGALELRVVLACPGDDAAGCEAIFTALQRLAMPQRTPR